MEIEKQKQRPKLRGFSLSVSWSGDLRDVIGWNGVGYNWPKQSKDKTKPVRLPLKLVWTGKTLPKFQGGTITVVLLAVTETKNFVAILSGPPSVKRTFNCDDNFKFTTWHTLSSAGRALHGGEVAGWRIFKVENDTLNEAFHKGFSFSYERINFPAQPPFNFHFLSCFISGTLIGHRKSSKNTVS